MSQVWVNFLFGLSEIRVDFHLLFLGPEEVPVANFGEGGISTDAETKKQGGSRSARTTRSLVPLARSGSASNNFRVESAVDPYCSNFDNSMYLLK